MLSELCYVYICKSFYFEGLFRLRRIVYSTHRWIHFFWLYVSATFIQLVSGCILLCPLLVWHDFIYLSNEYYCFILFTNVRATLWLILTIYGMPLLYLLIMYAWMIVFIHWQSNKRSLLVKYNQERELLALRRIFMSIGLLFVIAIPPTIFILMALITRQEHPLAHRITMVSYAMSMAVLSVDLVFATPQLKTLLSRMWQRNRVVPIDTNLTDTIELRPIAIIN
jgi:hypothetical protein